MVARPNWRPCWGWARRCEPGLIIGEPGLGKTRLLAEWQSADQAAAASPPLRWARGACPSDSRGLAYHLLLSLLRSLIGVPATTSEPDTRAALSALVQDLFASGEDGADEADEYIREYIRQRTPGQDGGAAVHASLALMLSLRPEGPALGRMQPLDPQTLQAQYLVALRQLLQALAARGPLVLVLENLHWADPSQGDKETRRQGDKGLYALVARAAWYSGDPAEGSGGVGGGGWPGVWARSKWKPKPWRRWGYCPTSCLRLP